MEQAYVFHSFESLNGLQSFLFCWNLKLATMKACAIEPDVNTKVETLECV